MKKTALSIALVLALFISAVFAIGMANSARTYPIPTGPLTPPVISMESPTSTTYVSQFVSFKFSVNGSWDGYVDHCFVAFSLDEESRHVIYDPPFRVNRIAQNFSTNLGPLSEGIHHLQIFATVGGVYLISPNYTTLESNDFTSQASVYFTVNTTNQAQISILSPLNETYNIDKMIPLEFTVNRTASIVKMGYTLDEQPDVIIPRNTSLYGPLSDGSHTLKVYSIFSDILPVFSNVNFTVDTIAPNVSILSLQNQVYNKSDIPLVFIINERAPLVGYSLDGKVFTVDGNTTLIGLHEGEHTLSVYATDEAGNAGTSEAIDFSVRLSPAGERAALIVTPPLATVLIGGPILLIYWKKRNPSIVKRACNDKEMSKLANTPLICPNCKKTLPEGNPQFCLYCGKSLKS